jgi:hypothetical protein
MNSSADSSEGDHQLGQSPAWMLPAFYLLSDNTSLREWYREWKTRRQVND